MLSETASHVTWSRRTDKLKFPYKNVTYKPDVKRFTKTGAEFIDDTEEAFTVIFYATGYNFDYPFLTNDSGITFDNSFVQPLYKEIFNIGLNPPSTYLNIFVNVELMLLIRASNVAIHWRLEWPSSNFPHL